MAVRVVGTGVLIRLATEAEERAVEQARRGRGFTPEPGRSYRFTEPDGPLGPDETYVVSQAFVDFVADGSGERWVGAEHHGHRVSLTEDVTIGLLRLARETAEDGLIDLLGDMGIDGIAVSRWQLFSAPHRIDLTPELLVRVKPLRRR